MTRITSTVLVVLILMNGTATIMSASGLSQDTGVQIAPGVTDTMDKVIVKMKEGFNPNVNVIQSFISMAVAGMRLFQVVITGVYAAPTAMANLLGGGELVNTIVTVLFAPMYLIATLELVFMATGRDMV